MNGKEEQKNIKHKVKKTLEPGTINHNMYMQMCNIHEQNIEI